jgi:hypothetical protein
VHHPNLAHLIAASQFVRSGLGPFLPTLSQRFKVFNIQNAGFAFLLKNCLHSHANPQLLGVNLTQHMDEAGVSAI